MSCLPKCYFLKILFQPKSISLVPGACVPTIMFIVDRPSPCMLRV